MAAAHAAHQNTEAEPATEDGWQRWCWLRHWEFWLALTLGAFLHLWAISTTQFLDDQTGLYALARESVLRHAIPLTGIPSSIGTLNPPLSIFLLLPFAAVTANPLPAVVFIALWNLLGVVLCYIFGLRYFGRRIAAVGTLLFATSAAALNYSRFLWQQNYLPPLMALWAITLYMGAVRGKRRWLAGNILLLGLAILLHPTAALLAPVTLAGILLAPRFPRLRAYVVAAIGLFILFVPTLIFEAVSRGSDLRLLAHYALRGGHFNTQIFAIFIGALSGAGSRDLGATTPYAATAAWFQIIVWGAVLLVVAGWVVLTVRVCAPAVALWHDQAPTPPSLLNHLKAWGIALWRGLRADAVWRARFLLWLWVTLPPVTMLRHSGNLFVHYLLVIYPALFLVGGFGVDWLIARFAARSANTAPLVRRAVPTLALAIVALVVFGEGLRFFLYPTSIATGNFQAYVSYGYPLDELLALDGQLSALQRQQGATATYIVTPQRARFGMPATYILAADRADRVAFPQSCLALPAPNDGPALAVSLAPHSAPETLLESLPNAHVVANVPLAGGNPLAVYRITGATPALPDESAVAGVSYLNGGGGGLRLDGVSFTTPGMLRLRWTILGAAPPGPGSPLYRVQLHLPGVAAKQEPQANCVATHLHAGETLFTWIALPAQFTLTRAEVVAGLVIQVSAGTQAFDEFSVGPLRFVTDRGGGAPLQPLSFAAQP